MARLANGLAIAAVAACCLPAAAFGVGGTRIYTVAGGGASAPANASKPATSAQLLQPTVVKSIGDDGRFSVSDSSCRALLVAQDAGADTGPISYEVGFTVSSADACTGTPVAPPGLGGVGSMSPPFSFGHPCCFADFGNGGLIAADSDYGRVEFEDGNGRIKTLAGSTPTTGCGGNSPPAAPTSGDPAAAQFCRITSLDVADTDPYGSFLFAEAHRQNDSPVGAGKGDLYLATGTVTPPTPGYTLSHVTGNYRIAAAVFSRYGVPVIADGHAAIIAILSGSDAILAGDYDPATNTGQGGFSGDGGAATQARLDGPAGVTFDWGGKLLIADTNNCRIRASDTNDLGGHIHTIAGRTCQQNPPADIGDGGLSSDAYLGHPMGLAMTSRGLLIADRDDNRIRLIDHTSIISAPAGPVASATPQFTFASLDGSPRFQCKLDAATPAACESPFTLPAGASDGQHTLAVWDAGHTAESSEVYWAAPADPTPATSTFTIDTTPPNAFALQQPAASASSPEGSPTFTWDAATDATTSVDHYELWIDNAKNREVPLAACLGSACSAQPTAPIAEGEHSWQIRALDNVGNSRSSEERALTIGSPPNAAFLMSPNPALAGRAVTFDASGSSDTSGISRYEWDLDGDGSFETDAGGNTTTTRSYDAPASVEITLRVTDGTGKQSTAAQPLKITTPQGAQSLLGISINSGAQYTNDPNVTLLVKAPTTATSIVVSNDGGFLAPATFPIATSVKWKLDSSGPERLPKTVYTRFLLGPIISETYADDIILDEIPPKVQSASVTAPAAAARIARLRSYTVKVKATDSNSGVAKVQVTANKRKPGKLIAYKTKLKLKLASKPKFLRAQDRAGNFSAWKKLH
jgi:hypothetical protein